MIMDPRTITLVLVVAIIIFFYFGLAVVLWCALAGGIIALLAFIYGVARAEGKIKKFHICIQSVWKKYEKKEAKFFKWLDNM